MGGWGSLAEVKAIHLEEGKLQCQTRTDSVRLWHAIAGFRSWVAIYLVMVYTINTLGEGKPYRTNHVMVSQLKTPRKENLANQTTIKMEHNKRKSSRIARRAVKQGARPSVADQAGVEKLATGTNSSTESLNVTRTGKKPTLAHQTKHQNKLVRKKKERDGHGRNINMYCMLTIMHSRNHLKQIAQPELTTSGEEATKISEHILMRTS